MAKKTWSLLAVLLGACAIPNITIVEKLDEASGGSGSGKSGSANQAGTKNNNQGGNAGEPEMPVGGDPGEPTAGTNSPPTGGKPSTGGTPPTAGGGSGPNPGKTAVAKFCNAVVVAGEAVSFDLRIGEGANLVHIPAESGSCTPAVPRPCIPIQSGSAVPVGIYDLDGNELYPAQVRIEPGEAWIFTLYYDESIQDARLAGKSDITADECSSTDFDDLLGPTTPAP